MNIFSWRHGRLGARLGAVVAVVLGCNAVTIIAALHGLSRVEASLQRLVNVNTIKSDGLAEMRFAIATQADRVRNIALTADVAKMKPDQAGIEAAARDYAQAQARVEALGLSAAETADLATAKALAAKAGPLVKRAQALARSLASEAAAAVLTDELAPVQTQWLAALQKLSQAAVEERSAVLAEAVSARRAAVVATAIAGIAAVLFGGFSAWLLARGITRRLSLGTRVAEQIAQGDLTAEVDGSGADEVAQLLRAVQDMQNRLLATVTGIKRAADSIQIASTEIAAGNQDLSARTEQQAASLQQTAASMSQMTDTVSANADNAQQAKQLASNATLVAEHGGEMIGRVITTMGEIQVNTRKIGDIIGVIDGIAFQTNILALNAAVEAARAGEQGRGFAVVASEVRSLAQRCAEAAKEIKSLVGRSVGTVESGSLLVDEAGTTMTEIVAQVRRVGGLIGEISDSSSTQNEGIGQVNSAVGQLDEMTQRNAALVEEAAAAAESLKVQSASLARMVAVFRVEGATSGL